MQNKKIPPLDSKPRKTSGLLRGKHLTGQAPLDKRHLTGQVRVNPFFNPSLSVIITALFAVMIMGFGESARAAVDLPWSTSYDCDCDGNPANGDTDWLQYTDTLICDGLGKYGSSQCTGGEWEQITSAANMAAGGGGKGQRHWEGDGQNRGSGGTAIEFNLMQPELWIRWYMRYELGFTWSGSSGLPGYDKILYITGAKSLVPELSYDEVLVAYAGAGSTGNKGWTYINSGSTGDGQWHCHEIHLKDGSSNGVAEWWIDGVQVINKTGIDMGSGGWDRITIGSNQNRPQNGRCMAVDFDDIAISNTGYIGPISASDTTPPSRSNPQPTGTLSSGTTQTIISLDTEETATCKYSVIANTNYDDMSNVFAMTDSTDHLTDVTDLEDGNSYTYYIRCQDESNNQNTDDFEISFSIASSTTYSISNFINMVTDWLKSESGLESDVNGDGVVNTRDLGIMMSNWQN